jgi:hypothetical protein
MPSADFTSYVKMQDIIPPFKGNPEKVGDRLWFVWQIYLSEEKIYETVW